MSSKKIKLLITGPGHGHNISYPLDFLNNSSSFETIFLTSNYSFDRNRFQNIRIIDYYHPNKYLSLIKLFTKTIFLPKVNILYMQDKMGYYFFLLKWFLRYDKLIFTVWSEYIIGSFKEKGLIGIIARAHLKNADFIICNWHGTYNQLINADKSFASKTKVLPWGFSISTAMNEFVNTDFIKKFLDKIDDKRFVLLNMRSFSNYNAIEVLLDALLLIKTTNVEVFDNLLLILWHGNNVDNEKLAYIKRFIRDKNIENNIWCVEHPFVPEADLERLILRSNVIVNLVKHDQLSTSIIEAMFFEKELLCSDIEPYQILNKKYNAQLNLIKIDPSSVANEIIRLKTHFDSRTKQDVVMKHRKSIVENHFSKEKNENEIINFLRNAID
jgi:hypothetical protein